MLPNLLSKNHAAQQSEGRAIKPTGRFVHSLCIVLLFLILVQKILPVQQVREGQISI